VVPIKAFQKLRTTSPAIVQWKVRYLVFRMSFHIPENACGNYISYLHRLYIV